MIFNTRFKVKKAMKTFSMVNKNNLVVKYIDLTRFVVRCIPGCPFCLKVSKPKYRNHWQVVTFKNRHTCRRIATNRQATTEWISNKILPLLRHTPTIVGSSGLRIIKKGGLN